MELIDKSAVVAEIERRIKKYATIDVGKSSELDALYGAKCKALMEILSFLDTLEVKEWSEEDSLMKENNNLSKSNGGTTMIKEAYCSYDISKLLKEKGFDEECTHYYDIDDGIEYTNGARIINSSTETYCTSPTHQMACAWLREKYHLWCEISPEGRNTWFVDIYSLKEEEYIMSGNKLHNIPTYEEATEAAIKYCLENLI